MIPTWKVHQRFQTYWGNEYKHSDINKVCQAIANDCGKANPKGGCLVWCRNNWATVCNWLVKWEGNVKGIGY